MNKIENLEKRFETTTELAKKYRRQSISLKKQIEFAKANDLLQAVEKSGLSIEQAKVFITTGEAPVPEIRKEPVSEGEE